MSQSSLDVIKKLEGKLRRRDDQLAYLKSNLKWTQDQMETRLVTEKVEREKLVAKILTNAIVEKGKREYQSNQKIDELKCMHQLEVNRMKDGNKRLRKENEELRTMLEADKRLKSTELDKILEIHVTEKQRTDAAMKDLKTKLDESAKPVPVTSRASQTPTVSYSDNDSQVSDSAFESAFSWRQRWKDLFTLRKTPPLNTEPPRRK